MNAIRSIRGHPPAVFTPSLQSCLSQHKSSVISLRPIITSCCSKQPENQESMEKDENPEEKSVDVMSDSFGEGYATRSDEEGFGSIYGEQKQSLKREEIDEDPAAYDKNQGSEVKEKEKARHQTHVST